MDYIYMDNFRGFQDTVVPLKQVNFLVGENSTGKTSVLALLNLLSTPEFWWRQDFNCGQYQFGGYSDIVSAVASDKTEFRIGLCRYPHTNTKRSPYCALLHFRERQGLPKIYKFSMAENDWAGSAKIDGKSVMYRIDNLTTVCKNVDDASCFLRCVERYSQETQSGFTKVPPKMRFMKMGDLFDLTELLQRLSKEPPAKQPKGFDFPPLEPEVVTLAPIRTKPRPTYDGYSRPFNPEGEHTPHLLRKYLTSRSKAQTIGTNLDEFGQESGLFQHIGIRKFGREQSAPFEVNITLGNTPLAINSVGYGVSQILPVVVELFSRIRGTCFSIQQPEIHLHPKAQAVLGDLLYQVAAAENKTLFVETHSDYMIDRFRYALSTSKKKVATQIMYFEKKAGVNKMTPIPILESGKYPTQQPPGFRGFFINESIRNLEI
jgi:hypothetical protein